VKVPEKLLMKARELVANDPFRVVPEYKNVYALCPLCGNASWVMGREKQEDMTPVVESEFGRPCDECERMQRLHPEVFAWVVSVLGFTLERVWSGT
jgi:hypothetical protein